MRGGGEGAGYGMQYTSVVIVRNYLCVPKQLHSLECLAPEYTVLTEREWGEEGGSVCSNICCYCQELFVCSKTTSFTDNQGSALSSPHFL